MLLAMRQAQERIERVEQAIRMAVPDWSLAEVVTALMALRGIDFISATAFLAEIGDLSRFRTPRVAGHGRLTSLACDHPWGPVGDCLPGYFCERFKDGA
jgi:hypothetical protein